MINFVSSVDPNSRSSISVNQHLNSNLTGGISQSNFVNLVYKIHSSHRVDHVSSYPKLRFNRIVLLRAACEGLCAIFGITPAPSTTFYLMPSKLQHGDKHFILSILRALSVPMNRLRENGFYERSRQGEIRGISEQIYISKELVDDPTVAIEMLRVSLAHCKVFRAISSRLKDDKNFILKLFSVMKTWNLDIYDDLPSRIFTSMPRRFLSDRDVMLAILEYPGFSHMLLHTCSTEIQHDLECNLKVFMHEAMRPYPMEWMHHAHGLRSEELFSQPQVIEKMKFWSRKESVIPWERYPNNSSRHIASKIFIMTSDTYQDPYFASILDNLEMVYLAVKKKGVSLRLASIDLRNNRDVVKAAVRQDGRALKFASNELRISKSIVLAALSNTSNDNLDMEDLELCPLAYTSQELRHDKEVILASLKYCGCHTLKYAHEIIANDLRLALQLVSEDGCFLQHVSSELKKNTELVFAAVKQTGHALQYADEQFRRNRSMVLKMVQLDIMCVAYLCDGFRGDRDVIMEAIQNHGSSLFYASAELRNDREVVTKAVKQCGWALAFASEELQNDSEVVMLSTSVMYGSLYYFASPNLRNGGLVDYVYRLHSRSSMILDDYLSTFVFGFALVNSMSSQLTLLNGLGEEALLDFQLQVAEYAGVRVGMRWTVIHNASKRLMLNLNEVKCAEDFVDERKDLESMFRFISDQKVAHLSQNQNALRARLIIKLKKEGLYLPHD